MNRTQTCINWAQEELAKNEYIITGPLEVIREVPWSKVSRFQTTHGFIYFKQMAPIFSNEAVLVQYLFDNITTNVPQIIASNNTLQCFLMHDAGTSFRELLKQQWNSDLYAKVLALYAQIQQSAVSHIDNLLAKNVPDWRLNKLPELYSKLMDNESLLQKDGLTLSEIKTLQNLHARFSDQCSLLSKFKIPETLEHNDFHDNNILILDKNIVINDWGDAVISHPFLSLAGCLNSAKRNHKLEESDEKYLALKNTYLDQWKEYGTNQTLEDAFSIAKTIRLFQFTLSFSRIEMCDQFELFPQYHGYMAEALKELIEALN